MAPRAGPSRGMHSRPWCTTSRQCSTASACAPQILAGHSLAGVEMTRLAADEPDSVVGLIYIDAAHDLTTIGRVRLPQFCPSARTSCGRWNEGSRTRKLSAEHSCEPATTVCFALHLRIGRCADQWWHRISRLFGRASTGARGLLRTRTDRAHLPQKSPPRRKSAFRHFSGTFTAASPRSLKVCSGPRWWRFRTADTTCISSHPMN